MIEAITFLMSAVLLVALVWVLLIVALSPVFLILRWMNAGIE